MEIGANHIIFVIAKREAPEVSRFFWPFMAEKLGNYEEKPGNYYENFGNKKIFLGVYYDFFSHK